MSKRFIFKLLISLIISSSVVAVKALAAPPYPSDIKEWPQLKYSGFEFTESVKEAADQISARNLWDQVVQLKVIKQALIVEVDGIDQATADAAEKAVIAAIDAKKDHSYGTTIRVFQCLRLIATKGFDSFKQSFDGKSLAVVEIGDQMIMGVYWRMKPFVANKLDLVR